MSDTYKKYLSELEYSYLQREFQIAYQPIFSLVSHQIVGFEALLRWQQDRMTLYSVDFMPMIQSAGLSFSVNCWVLRETCRQMRHWLDHDLVHETMQVSVNLFTEYLEHDQLIEQISAVLTETRLPGSMLCLNLTQNKIIDAPQARLDNLQYLSTTLGVRLCLDDFNPTAKALAFLQDYSVYTVKIGSKKVLHQMAGAFPRARRVLKKIQYFGTRVIFKGIEHEAQRLAFKALGCQCYAQGCLFASPLPQRKITQLISRSISQGKSQTLVELKTLINKISLVAITYLGFNVSKRYWQLTRPRYDGLSVLRLTQDPENLFEVDIDLILDRQQQRYFKKWVLAFIDRCSLIIHDFSILVLQSSLTCQELLFMKIVISDECNGHPINDAVLQSIDRVDQPTDYIEERYIV